MRSWRSVGGGGISPPDAHTVAPSVTVSRARAGLFTTCHTARRLALLCRTLSVLAALPSTVSRSQRLEHKSPCVPVWTVGQALQGTRTAGGSRSACRSRQRRWRAALVGSLGMNFFFWQEPHHGPPVPGVAAGQRSAGSWIGLEQAEQEGMTVGSSGILHPSNTQAAAAQPGSLITQLHCFGAALELFGKGQAAKFRHFAVVVYADTEAPAVAVVGFNPVGGGHKR